jgi:hypothetical protein
MVIASLVHLVMRHQQNSCHVMKSMFSKPIPARFLLTFSIRQPPVLPSLLVSFKQADALASTW